MLHSDMAHCTSTSYSKSFLFYYVFLVVQDIYSLAQRSQVGCGGLLLDHSAAQVVDVAFAARWGCSDAWMPVELALIPFRVMTQAACASPEVNVSVPVLRCESYVKLSLGAGICAATWKHV